MSVLQYPDGFDAADLQVWNNAAFDHGGESEPLTWASSNKPGYDCVNLTLSLESDDCSKENRTPMRNSQVKLLDLNLNLPVEPESASPVLKARCSTEGGKAGDGRRESRDIDAEIEEIEREISRLFSRLEALRLEKEKEEEEEGKKLKVDVAAPPPPVSILKPKISRRGVSLGPVEIASAVKSRPPNKLEITPIPSVQSRRKSCFWKLQEIDELKVTKERRKSLSLTVSPKTRKMASKTQPLKQAATTVGSKRVGVRKEEGVISSIQPKTLFKEGEKSAKKPAKPGRVIPSRYNQITASAARKRSFPENKEEADRFDKRRASQGSSTTSESAKGKKRWEIPREVVLYKSSEDDPSEEDKKKTNTRETPSSMVRITEVLPKIRTVRNFVNESPRDSGPAKRAAELVGRRNYFGSGGEEPPFCQALSFLEDVEEE